MSRRLVPSLILSRLAFLGLFAPLLGCPPMAASVGLLPASFPQRSCEAAWAGRSDVDYDVERDRRACPQGNCGYAEYAARIDRASCFKQWTVLLYMAADVDTQLAPWALENLLEMEDGVVPSHATAETATTPRADVVVQLDSRSDPANIRRLHVFRNRAAAAGADPAALLRAAPADLRSPIVKLLPHHGTDTPEQLLRDFLTWGIRAYPAQHYLVVVWGHGQGWGENQRQPIAGAPGTPFPGFSGGLALDFRQRTYLGIPALHKVLQQAAAVAGRRLDIYASDACLMQSVEVAAELSDAARYITGTTQIEPLGGLPYGELLSLLNDSALQPAPACSDAADATACTVSSLLPGRYAQALQRPPRRELHAGHPQPAALSVLRGAELRDALLPALADLGTHLASYLTQDSIARIRLREQVSSGGSALGNSRELTLLLSDLHTVLDEADGRHAAPQAAGELRQSLAQVQHALLRALLSTSVPDRGLSIWIPPTREDYQRNKARYGSSLLFQYERPAATQPGAWESFLARLWD